MNYLNSLEKENNEYLQVIRKMLLFNKIRISDLPFYLRTSRGCFYVMALRVSRHFSCDRYIEDLNLLFSDIQKCSSDKRNILINILKSNIDCNYYSEDETFENFKEAVMEKILL